MNGRLVLGLVLMIAVVIFTLQNTDIVSIRFLFWQLSLSRALMIFVLLGAGIIIGWIAGSLRRGIRK
jgi:uncharacterized integral membrane protein